VSPVGARTGTTTGITFGLGHGHHPNPRVWVAPSVHTIRVPAGVTRLVPFTVKVPRGAKPGDHMAGLAFRQRRLKSQGTKPIGITEVVRNVIGIEIVLPGHVRFLPRLRRVWFHTVGNTGIGAVYVRLANHGLKLGKPKLTVTLVGPHHYRRRLVRQLDTVLPNSTISYPFTWPVRLASGRYRVTAVLSAGGRSAVLHRVVHLHRSLAG
jgi:hypothetical protein